MFSCAAKVPHAVTLSSWLSLAPVWLLGYQLLISCGILLPSWHLEVILLNVSLATGSSNLWVAQFTIKLSHFNNAFGCAIKQAQTKAPNWLYFFLLTVIFIQENKHNMVCFSPKQIYGLDLKKMSIMWKNFKKLFFTNYPITYCI